MSQRTVTIVLPDGYRDADEFVNDCGFELASAQVNSMDIAETIYHAQVDHKPYLEVARTLKDRFYIWPKANPASAQRG